MKIRILSCAEAEIAETVDYYNGQFPGLGFEFAADMITKPHGRGDGKMIEMSKDILHRIAGRLAEEMKPLEIYLFGSRAWGTPSASSDFDLMVIVPDCSDTVRSLKLRARRCLRDIILPIDLLIESKTLFQSRCSVSASLESQIASKGVCLYERGES